MKFTRQDYMTGKVSHNEYYSQFITDSIIETIDSRLGNAIRNSTDEHFNDILLSTWDSFAPMIRPQIKNASLSDCVCVAKAAARIIKNKQ